jgi:hypothetical protein
MKAKIILILFLSFSGIKIFSQGQDSLTNILKRIETSVNGLNKNVGDIKEETVKKDPQPFTGQSIFEDRKGMSAIFIPSGGVFRLNTADGSLKISFTNRVSTKHLFYGADVSGKTNDGILPLITEGRLSPGIKLNGVVGFQELFRASDNMDGWVLLKLGYEGSNFKLYDPEAVFSNQFKDSNFNSFTSSISFNIKIHGNSIIAISGGYQKLNNYDDLKEIEVTDTKTFNDPVTNTTRVSKKTIKGRQGAYEETNSIPINIDGFWTPTQTPRIGVYHYWRTKFTEGKTINGLGSGLYLLKKKNPLAAIAGIVFEIPDLSKVNDGFGKNLIVNFIVGYNFGFSNK